MSLPELKVLLADDVRLELEIEKTFFQRSGFHVLAASDGLAALAMAVSSLPDLVILDQVMPGMTGIQVCKELKSRRETRHIPVVITSGETRKELPDECTAAGAEAFVPKSEGRDALLSIAAKILKVPERRPARMTVCFKVQGIVGAKESLGKAVELSEGGMCLETTRLYSSGDSFHLRFLLPGERSEVHAGALVVAAHQRPDGVFALSLKFTDVNEEDRNRLNRHLDLTLARR